MDVAISFSGSRLAGTSTTASRPSAAARAATAFARLPVDEHESVVRPSSIAFAAATATTRSLNECVGLAVSSFSQSSPSPSVSARRGAWTSGVKPGASRCSAGAATGSRSAYRQIDERAGRDRLAADGAALRVAVVDGIERPEATGAHPDGI